MSAVPITKICDMVPMATNGSRAGQAVQVLASQEKVWTFIFSQSNIESRTVSDGSYSSLRGLQLGLDEDGEAHLQEPSLPSLQ